MHKMLEMFGCVRKQQYLCIVKTKQKVLINHRYKAKVKRKIVLVKDNKDAARHEKVFIGN